MLAAPPPSLAGIARASTQRGQHWDGESADPGAGDLDGCGPGAPRPSSSRPSTPRSITDDEHQGRAPRAGPKATSGVTYQRKETIMETQWLPTQRTDAQGYGRQGEDPPPLTRRCFPQSGGFPRGDRYTFVDATAHGGVAPLAAPPPSLTRTVRGSTQNRQHGDGETTATCTEDLADGGPGAPRSLSP